MCTPLKVVRNYISHQLISNWQRAYSSKPKEIKFTFIDRLGKPHPTKANVGDNLLDVVRDNELDFVSFGVCDATVSCSTCHVILPDSIYKTLGDVDVDEEDMLDLASGLTLTSRLGCQVEVIEEMEGCQIKLPKIITDARQL